MGKGERSLGREKKGAEEEESQKKTKNKKKTRKKGERKNTKKTTSSQKLEGWGPFHNRHLPDKTRRHLCSNNIKGLHPTPLTLCEKGPDMFVYTHVGGRRLLSKSSPRSVADGPRATPD